MGENKGHGHRQIRLDSEADPAAFRRFLSSPHRDVTPLPIGGRAGISAHVGRGFVAAQVSWPSGEARLTSALIGNADRLLVVLRRGAMSLRVRDAETLFAAGEALTVAVSSDPIVIRSFAAQSEFMLLAVDFGSRDKGERAQGKALVRCSEASVNVVTSATVAGLARAPLPRSRGAARVLHSKAAGLVRDHLALAPSPTEGGAYVSALRHIELHAADSNLSPLGVAESIGVSLRTLQRGFRANEESIARSIRQARAELARNVWRENSALRAPDVAAVSGFGTTRRMRAALAESRR